jgi:hypothetical protein
MSVLVPGNRGAVQASQVDGSTSDPTTTSGTYATINQMTLTLTGLTIGSILEVQFTGQFYHGTPATISDFRLALDTTGIAASVRSINAPGSNYYFEVVLHRIITVTATSHQIDVQWKTAAATLTAAGTNRTLVVKELRTA